MENYTYEITNKENKYNDEAWWDDMEMDAWEYEAEKFEAEERGEEW